MSTSDAGSEEDLTQEQVVGLARDRRLRWWLLMGAAVLTVGTVVVAALVAHARHPDEPVRWIRLMWIAAGVFVLYSLSAVVGVRLRSRSTSLQRLVVSGDRATIRRVAKQLRRGEPVAGDDLDVARAVVASTRTQRWLPWLFSTMGVLNLLPLVLGRDDAHPQPTFVVAARVVGAIAMMTVAAMAESGRRRVLRGAARQHLTVE
ncbi:hypothetical protein V3N99_12275 [Dermatophilaceae bacterium Soc4.6]